MQSPRNMVVFSHLGVFSLKKNFVVFPRLVLGLAAMAHAQAAAPTKVAIINVQKAILQTKDGQKAAGELQAKFTAQAARAREEAGRHCRRLQDQMRKGSATMSEDAKAKLMRDIDANQKSLQRDTEDFEADVQQEEGKIMQELGQKMMDVIIKYATAERLRDGARRQQPADAGAVGRSVGRYHRRDRQAVRSGASGNRRGAAATAKPATPGRLLRGPRPNPLPPRRSRRRLRRPRRSSNLSR